MSAPSIPGNSIVLARRSGNPAWTGFVATLVSELKLNLREPSALVFTLAQPLILLLILDTFNFSYTDQDGRVRPYIDRLLPGMVVFVGMNLGLQGIAFVLARYKQRGTLRRLRATPLPTSSFIGGVIVSRVIVAFLNSAIALYAGLWLFGATLDGNQFAVLGLGVAGALVFMPIGILAVALARTEDDIPPFVFLPLTVSILFSGIFLDRAGLPDWLAWVTAGLPLTLLTDAVQVVASGEGGWGDIWGDLAGMAAWTAGITALASWRFKMS